MKFLGLTFLSAIIAGVLVTACSTKPVATSGVQKYQEVEFVQSEVPYIQAVKKDGKMSAIIVDGKTQTVAKKPETVAR